MPASSSRPSFYPVPGFPDPSLLFPINGTRFSFILIITKRIPIKSSHLPILERVRVPPPSHYWRKLAHSTERQRAGRVLRSIRTDRRRASNISLYFAKFSSSMPNKKPNVRQLLAWLTFVLPTATAPSQSIRKLSSSSTGYFPCGHTA